MSLNERCPRCENPRLKSWAELNDDEREVVKRLPQSADFSLAERQATRRWCTRCWYEESSHEPHA